MKKRLFNLKKFNVNQTNILYFLMVVLFLGYISYGLLIRHSLFVGSFMYFYTVVILVIISFALPYDKIKKIEFKDILKGGLVVLPFILTAIIFLFIQATKMLEDINKITNIDKSKLANSIIWLFILSFALLFFSYLSDNIKNKRWSKFYYKLLIFCVLFFTAIIISLFGSLVSYYTYIPGP